MSDQPGSRWQQLKSTDRHGNALTGQASDGTGTRGNQAVFDAEGNLTDGGPPAIWSVDTGSANAYALTFVPWPTVAAGLVVKWQAANANTGASTVSINGIVYPLHLPGNAPLAGGEISQHQIVEAAYDAVDNAFQLLGSSFGSGSGGGGSSTIITSVWYGQQPRGTQNSSNTNFALDFSPLSPYTLLSLNGVIQRPGVDGSGPLSNPDYTINGTQISFSHPPSSTDWLYIWYFKGNVATTVPITNATMRVWLAHNTGTGQQGAVPSVVWYSADGSQSASLNIQNGDLFSLTEFAVSLPLPSNPSTASWSNSYVEFAQLDTVFGQPQDYLYIYDVYLTMQLISGDFVSIRPYTYRFQSGSQGQAGTNYAWQANTTYAQGVYVIDSNGNLQLATNNGTSGSSNPAWGTTTGALTGDNTMTWQFYGPQNSGTGQITNPTLAYDIENSPPATYATMYRQNAGSVQDPGRFDVIF